MAMLELLGLPPQGDRLARLRALREALAGVQVFFFFFIPEATFQMLLDYP
jgi:hypothetical protein